MGYNSTCVLINIIILNQLKIVSFTMNMNFAICLISYTADKEIGIQPITEILVLNVTDSRQNLLPNQVLSIVVEPVDNQPPSVVVGEGIQV